MKPLILRGTWNGDEFEGFEHPFKSDLEFEGRTINLELQFGSEDRWAWHSINMLCGQLFVMKVKQIKLIIEVVK